MALVLKYAITNHSGGRRGACDGWIDDGVAQLNFAAPSDQLFLDAFINKYSLSLIYEVAYTAFRQLTLHKSEASNQVSREGWRVYDLAEKSSGRSSITNHSERGRRDDDGGEENDDGSGNRPPTSVEFEKKCAEKSLACPFYKRKPIKYQYKSRCAGPGWSNIHRVKEHLYRQHLRPIHCPRCAQTFNTGSLQSEHIQRSEACEVRPELLLAVEGISDEQKSQLKSKKGLDNSRTEEWRRMYMILFPDDDPCTIPSPYHSFADQSNGGSSTIKQGEIELWQDSISQCKQEDTFDEDSTYGSNPYQSSVSASSTYFTKPSVDSLDNVYEQSMMQIGLATMWSQDNTLFTPSYTAPLLETSEMPTYFLAEANLQNDCDPWSSIFPHQDFGLFEDNFTKDDDSSQQQDDGETDVSSDWQSSLSLSRPRAAGFVFYTVKETFVKILLSRVLRRESLQHGKTVNYVPPILALGNGSDGTSSTTTVESAGSKRGKKRAASSQTSTLPPSKRIRSTDRGNDEDEDLDRGPGAPENRPDAICVATELPLACHFYKMNPVLCTKSEACAGPGWTDIGRLKEHIYRNHELPIFCYICHIIFSDEDELELHAKSIRCEPSPGLRPLGFTRKQKVMLKSKKRFKGETIVDRWKRIWTTLFPDLPMPLPFYEPKDADEYAKLKELKDLLVQELPKRLCERVYPSFSELSNADQVSLRSGLEAAVREESDAIFSIYTRQVSSTLSIDQPTDKSSSTRQLNELITVDQEARLAELRHEALISEIFEDTFVRAPM